jgi:adenylate cyclase
VTKDDNDTAVRMLDKAIDLDPDFAQAYAWKACVLGQRFAFGFSDAEGNVVLEQAFAALDKALALDANDVECHRLLCEVHMLEGDLDQAAVQNEQALTLNPNDPRLVAQKGELLTWQGHPEDGAAWIEQAMRLDPYGAPRRVHLLGRAMYCQGRFEEAAEAYRKIAVPRQGQRAEFAACLAQLDQTQEAHRVAAEVREKDPEFVISSYLDSLSFEDIASRDSLADGMRKAGLPE